MILFDQIPYASEATKDGERHRNAALSERSEGSLDQGTVVGVMKLLETEAEELLFWVVKGRGKDSE